MECQNGNAMVAEYEEIARLSPAASSSNLSTPILVSSNGKAKNIYLTNTNNKQYNIFPCKRRKRLNREEY